MFKSSAGHSATVRIELHINGTRLRVAKIGPDRLYFDSPQALPASEGEVRMHIDAHERRWRVTLHPNGPSRIVPATFDEWR